VVDENAEVVSLPQAPDAIELRHLRAFVAVADELNFGRAATRLYLSQPALSRQIRSLERLVGCDLLRRSTHRVELTLAGEALLDRARGLLREVDEAVSAARSVGGELLARIARHWESFAEVSPADLQELRIAFEGLHAQFEPPPGITVRSVNAGGVPGLLLAPGPEVKLEMTRSSQESVNASSQPERMAGKMIGSVMRKNTLTGRAPKSMAASSRAVSKVARREFTITVT